MARWQNRLTPYWKPLAGGFSIEQLHTGYLNGPRPMTLVYRGWAH